MEESTLKLRDERIKNSFSEDVLFTHIQSYFSAAIFSLHLIILATFQEMILHTKA